MTLFEQLLVGMVRQSLGIAVHNCREGSGDSWDGAAAPWKGLQGDLGWDESGDDAPDMGLSEPVCPSHPVCLPAGVWPGSPSAGTSTREVDQPPACCEHASDFLSSLRASARRMLTYNMQTG